MFALVRTIEEFAIEQLYGDYGENKLEQYVHDENVDDVFQRIYDAIEDCFQFRNAFDGFQGSQDAQYPQRFDRREILTGAAATAEVQHMFYVTCVWTTEGREYHQFALVVSSQCLQQFHDVHGRGGIREVWRIAGRRTRWRAG